ncbi:hypothetical protein KDH83_02215 [Achromobacter sp. Marseille-Q0513]|uniref:hypothetical protein n=1 Tax=Achromobacter sp. Marseille-Q0513 TaxID=2829161 RepID=UPI001B9600CF|nr:hypothetical protein [Achromobacter sp. Marseille-Q0513]MBR8652119.1 hypothetical protein [Achromobacter sp. Marseille-Q0513]
MSRSPLIEAGTSQTGNLLQFLAWLSERPRSYADTMEAWKTSCPRLSAWEDATANGLVDTAHGSAGAGSIIVLTGKGRALLKAGKGA